MEDFSKCTVTGCDGIGISAYNGRCQMCYSACPQQLPEITINQTLRKLEGLKLRPDPVCLTSGCGNSGTSANGFCPQCYLRQFDSEGQVTTFQECVETGCKESGYKKLHGFCRKCFSASQIMDRSVIRKSSAEKDQQLCTTPNCEFYGQEEQNGQCSICFKHYLERKSLTKSHTDCSETAGNDHNDCSNSRMSKLRIVAPLDIHEPVNSDELFGSGADKRELTSSATSTKSLSQQTKFTVSKHKCKMVCGRKCVAQCDPYCMTCWEKLKLQPVEQAGMAQCPRNDVQPSCNPSSSLSDVFKSLGSEKPVSTFTLPLSQSSTEQGTKASPMADGEGPDWKNPESPPSGTSSGEGEPTDGEIPEKKKIRLKIVPLDKVDFRELCFSKAIICLWNKHNVDNGTHPLLQEIGEVIEDRQLGEFKTRLRHDLMNETGGGTSTASRVVHCKYDFVASRQVAKALISCLEFVEIRKETQLVFAFVFSDDLHNSPAVVMRAVMYAVSHIQTSTNYTQNLDKFCLYVGSKDVERQCKLEYKKILDVKYMSPSQSNRQKCHTCKKNPASKLKPLSGLCMDQCAVFCIQCLQQGRHSELDCPQHGRCFSPIGHKNTYALLLAGYDAKEKVAKLFVADVQDMVKTLVNESVIGIRKENIKVVHTETPGKKDDVKTKLLNALKYFRGRLRNDKDHARFFFYYSGHNSETGFKLGGGDNGITPKELKGELNKLHVESIITILDCCYSAGADMIPDDDGEDFTSSLSSCSKDDSEPVSYIPKLWNLESSNDCGDKGDGRKVYQWSSSRRKEISSYSRKRGGSFFTLSIVKAMMGECPLESDRCQSCKTLESKARNKDGVFLEAICETVCYHVKRLAREEGRNQNPKLDSNDDDDILLSFHSYRTTTCD